MKPVLQAHAPGPALHDRYCLTTSSITGRTLPLPPASQPALPPGVLGVQRTTLETRSEQGGVGWKGRAARSVNSRQKGKSRNKAGAILSSCVQNERLHPPRPRLPGPGTSHDTRACTCLARTSPFTITFLKGGCPKRAVASTSRV